MSYIAVLSCILILITVTHRNIINMETSIFFKWCCSAFVFVKQTISRDSDSANIIDSFNTQSVSYIVLLASIKLWLTNTSTSTSRKILNMEISCFVCVAYLLSCVVKQSMQFQVYFFKKNNRLFGNKIEYFKPIIILNWIRR